MTHEVLLVNKVMLSACLASPQKSVLDLKNPPALVESGARIGLLGGSFNPPHSGHREISLTALKALSLDQIWWLVSPANPQKDPNAYAQWDKRVEACIRISDHPRIHISDFEYKRALTYSQQTISALLETWPTLRFTWLMGADNLASFHTWQNWEGIMETLPIAVFNRPGYAAASLHSPAAERYQFARRRGCEVRRLASRDAPAWAYIRETANPESSTRLRKLHPEWLNSGETPS